MFKVYKKFSKSYVMSKFTNRPTPMNWLGSIISIKPVDWADKSEVAQIQVELDLTSHNSSDCLGLKGFFKGMIYIFPQYKGSIKFFCNRDIKGWSINWSS